MTTSTFPHITHYYASTVALQDGKDNDHYPHFLSQNLNNRASSLITKGNYEEAIVHLTEALKLTKLYLSDESKEDRMQCACKCCSLESCLMTIEKEEEQGQEQDDDVMALVELPANKTQKKKRSSSCSISSGIDFDFDFDFDDMYFDDDDDLDSDEDEDEDHPILERQYPVLEQQDEDEGFVYRRPLLVNQHSIDGGHYMGVTMSLIILFNLALAHHLKAIAIPADDAKKRLTTLQQALQLYEVAYQLHMEIIQHQPLPSYNADYDQNFVNLRLTMLVTNNLSEIHRLAGNSTKHKLCLQHVLSAMMYMTLYCDVLLLTPKEVDGFYHNVSPITMFQVCAAVA